LLATTDRFSPVKRLPPQSPAIPSTTQQQHPTPFPSLPSRLLSPDRLAQNNCVQRLGNVYTKTAFLSPKILLTSSPSKTACTWRPPPAPGSAPALAATRLRCPLLSAMMGGRRLGSRVRAAGCCRLGSGSRLLDGSQPSRRSSIQLRQVWSIGLADAVRRRVPQASVPRVSWHSSERPG